MFDRIVSGIITASTSWKLLYWYRWTKWYLLSFGGALAKVWSDNVADVNVKAEVTAASVENTIKVVRGDMIAGIAMGNVVLDAYKGEGKFRSEMPVKTLFALYPNLVHALTLEKSGITSLSQLKGKRISLGAPASGTAVTAAALLASIGIDVKKISTLSTSIMRKPLMRWLTVRLMLVSLWVAKVLVLSLR